MNDRDLDTVQLTQNIQELEKVRNDYARANLNGSNSTGHATAGAGNNRQEQGSDSRVDSRDERGTQRTSEVDRPPKAIRKRVRPTDREDVNSAKSNSGDDQRSERVVTDSGKGPTVFDRFLGKQQKKDDGPVKLLTETEIDEQRDHLMMVYLFLSSLPDTLLEIIVKEHDPVTIWQLSDDEAGALADIKLRQAKSDPVVAREVRSTLALYDRMYMYTLVIPRAIATRAYVQEHGGFSIK